MGEGVHSGLSEKSLRRTTKLCVALAVLGTTIMPFRAAFGATPGAKPVRNHQPPGTGTPSPTATNTAVPTVTATPKTRATKTPTPTSTPVPTATNTPVPTATNTPVPTATNTPVPTATNTPVPTATNTPVPPTATPTSSPIALGAFINDSSLSSGGAAPGNTTMLDNYATQVGRMPAIVMWYQNWGSTYNAFSSRDANAVISRGAIPEITWQPWAGTIADPKYKLTNITAGNFDSYISSYAQAVKTWGHPLYIRLMHEMTANWYPWTTGSGNPNGNTPAQFVAAWQHIHDIFAAQGATNVKWIWTPNKDGDSGATPAVQDYPGDAYVDYAGFDAYNYGAFSNNSQTLTQIYGPTYTDLTSFTNKPLIVGETGDPEINNNKASWLTQGLINDLPTQFPRIRAVVYFDSLPPSGHDWRVDTSSMALSSWKQVVADPYYRGTAP